MHLQNIQLHSMSNFHVQYIAKCHDNVRLLCTACPCMHNRCLDSMEWWNGLHGFTSHGTISWTMYIQCLQSCVNCKMVLTTWKCWWQDAHQPYSYVLIDHEK